jgi:hypothetical protein
MAVMALRAMPEQGRRPRCPQMRGRRSCSREVIAGFWQARVRCPSTVRAVRNRFWAISRSAAAPRAARAAG